MGNMLNPEQLNNDTGTGREVVGYLDLDDFGWKQLKELKKALELGECACSSPLKMVSINTGCCQDGE